MASDESGPNRTGAGGLGLSMFANLLDPSAPGTISRAPVLFASSADGESVQRDAISVEKKAANGSLPN